MKLSEAVILGGQGTDHIKGAMFRWTLKGELVGVCAVGACVRAMNPEALVPGLSVAKDDMLPDIFEERVVSPMGDKTNLFWAIANANDQLDWSFEQISEWLKGQGL